MIQLVMIKVEADIRRNSGKKGGGWGVFIFPLAIMTFTLATQMLQR
jgi:hypothetical protein